MFSTFAYALMIFAGCAEKYGWFGTAPSSLTWSGMFAVAACYSLCISQLTVATIGGNAFAGERLDRSAEFLYSLPYTRREMLASKLLLAVCIIAVIWFINVPVLYCFFQATSLVKFTETWLFNFLDVATTGATFFGVAWGLSSFLSNPTLAVTGGLFVPATTATALAVMASTSHKLDGKFLFTTVYPCICLPIALLCFTFGTWHYLRRVEP